MFHRTFFVHQVACLCATLSRPGHSERTLTSSLGIALLCLISFLIAQTSALAPIYAGNAAKAGIRYQCRYNKPLTGYSSRTSFRLPPTSGHGSHGKAHVGSVASLATSCLLYWVSFARNETRTSIFDSNKRWLLLGVLRL